MTKTLQAVVPVELAGRVARAAAKDGRSVSQWLRLLLERELGDDIPTTLSAVQRDVEPSECRHRKKRLVKSTEYGVKTFACDECKTEWTLQG